MLLTLIALAAAQAAAPEPDRAHAILNGGRRIAAQPVRDVGAARTPIPPVLERAEANPYGLAGTRSCTQIRSGIADLTAALGPDFPPGPGPGTRENRAGKLAEAGGKTIVNGLIPFRGLVREISGAAPQQRRLAAASSAGLARRGFLRGLAVARNCPLG